MLYFNLKKYLLSIKIILLVEKLKISVFFGNFFGNTFKVLWFYKFRWLHWEKKKHRNLSDYNQFLFKERFEVNRKQIFLVKKWEIHVIVFMILLSRYSEEIYNAMRCTGKYMPAIYERVLDLKRTDNFRYEFLI